MFKSFLYWLDKPAKDSLLERIEKEPITEKYFRAFAGSIIASIAVIVLGLLAIFSYNSQQEIAPKTFSVKNFTPPPVVNDLGQEVSQPTQQEVKEIVSLGGPIHQLKNVNRWLKEALMMTYSFNFLNFNKVVDEAYYYFTPDGYKMYLNALNSIALSEALENDLMNVSLVPVGEPTLINAVQYEDGTTTWLFRTNVIINYTAGSQELNDKYKVEALVVQVPPYKSIKGLGIAQYSLSKL